MTPFFLHPIYKIVCYIQLRLFLGGSTYTCIRVLSVRDPELGGLFQPLDGVGVRLVLREPGGQGLMDRARHISKHVVIPQLFTETACHDVASSIHQSLPVGRPVPRRRHCATRKHAVR